MTVGAVTGGAAGAAPRRWFLPAATFTVALAVLAPYYLALPVLYDTDSYYHLAVARLFAREGPVDALPWARFSLLADGFGDKELLFHLLLAPFATGDGSGGGRLALALLGAGVAALLVAVARPAVGRWALVVPPLVFLGSTDFLGRVIRLRPELLALLLVVAATVAAGRRRWWALGVAAFLYALAYTAFHALLGLAVLFFLHQGLVRRRWEWRLLAVPAVAVAVALVVHPHFPHNLAVWKVQSVDFFLHKDTLDVGREIRRAGVGELLRANGGWLAALAVLVVAAWRRNGDAPRVAASRDGEVADLLAVAAAAYGVLYLLMVRFSTYAVPLVTLAVLWALARRGRVPGRWIRLTGTVRVPTILALALALAVSAPATVAQLHGLLAARGELAREAEWAAFGRAVPDGARVAADWGLTHVFVFFAPQGRYLNVLDPVFMAVPHPDAYRALRGVMGGSDPDVPATVAADLDSDYLAVSALTSSPRLRRRLAADPRLVPRHAAYTLLYEVRPAGPAFLRTWRATPGEHPRATPAAVATWPPYARAEDPARRAVEGFVAVARVAPDGARCATFALPIVAEGPLRRHLELAPRGTATLWLDGAPRLEVGDRDAVLGTGRRLDLDLTAGRHLLTVVACGDGFYLVDRSADTSAASLRSPPFDKGGLGAILFT